MSKEKILFTVNGFEVRSNSIYKVKDKPDGDAPTGFQQAGTTKLPSAGVDESFQVPFKVMGPNGEGAWDTGFSKFSPCYANMDESAINATVKALKENLLDPYKRATGKTEAFADGNEEFFKKTNFKVFSGLSLNTTDIYELMTLYFALRAHQVAPEGSQGDSKYREAAYILVDKHKDVKEKDRRVSLKFKAIKSFSTLYDQDREKLFAILVWNNFRISESVDEVTLTGMFDEYVHGSPDKAEAFMNSVNEAENRIGLDKLLIFRKLKETATKNPKITRMQNGTYFYDGTLEIGKDLKSCAENIAKLKDLVKVKKEILLLDEVED